MHPKPNRSGSPKRRVAVRQLKSRDIIIYTNEATEATEAHHLYTGKALVPELGSGA
jgi:hypothetical protein